MPTTVRSYSKINLGLAIGPPRPDGFHELTTLYQTLALCDRVTVWAEPARETRIRLRSNDARVPCDGRNTAWKMVEKTLRRAGRTAQVDVFIQKNLPIQGGMGAGSANAAAALIGLEKELPLELGREDRMAVAAEVGSDVPLFLVGGSVLGTDRGQVVQAVSDVTLDGSAEIWCVMALPSIGVSTPLAFREWDRRFFGASEPDLHNSSIRDTLEELSCTYASVFSLKSDLQPSRYGTSGIFPDPSSAPRLDTPEKPQGLSREQRHGSLHSIKNLGGSGIEDDLDGNSLLALVRTGIENDFEKVVFPQYPLLHDIKRHLMGSASDNPGVFEGTAVYAALSGSGSALFGLYRSQAEANDAQQRLQRHGVEAIVTKTMPRAKYWSGMFAE